jgi:hypothetical protein
MLSLRDEGGKALRRNFDVEQGSANFFMAKCHAHFRGLIHHATREKIIISGIPSGLNYCSIFIVGTKFTNVAAGSVLETRDVEDHFRFLRLV